MAMSSTNNRRVTVPVIPLLQLQATLPLFQSVSAGFPSPADDFTEEELSLDSYLIRNRASTFFVRVEGNSMIGAGIYPDDILIIDKSLEAKLGDVIIALIDGDFTVKRFVRHNGQYYLQPENPKYKSIKLTDHANFMCWGVVTHVIHKPYKL